MEHSNELLNTFFSWSFENKINEKMFFRAYIFPEQEVIDYISSLIQIDLVEFIEYIRKHLSVSYIESSDIIQFSSLIDSTDRIAAIIDDKGDTGFTFLELGKLLLNDGIVRNDTAYRKYGENHTKTAQEFGITQLLYSKTYLTCIGKVMSHLSDADRNSILRRLILRNKYFMLIVIVSSKESISLESQMGLLSESTQRRRLSNIRKVWRFILSENDRIRESLSNVTL